MGTRSTSAGERSWKGVVPLHQAEVSPQIRPIGPVLQPSATLAVAPLFILFVLSIAVVFGINM